jgi:DnaK suppressor protein
VKRSRGEISADGIEDYVDYAVSSYTKEFLLSLSSMERRQLQLVEQAMRRIRDGSYGFCEECSEKIGKKRLEAVPWARHCIRCQEMEEKGLLPYMTLRESAFGARAAKQGSDDDDL